MAQSFPELCLCPWRVAPECSDGLAPSFVIVDVGSVNLLKRAMRCRLLLSR